MTLYHPRVQCPYCLCKNRAWAETNSVRIEMCPAGCPARRRITADSTKIVRVEFDYMRVLNGGPQLQKREVDW